jgi:hypothetical protein
MPINTHRSTTLKTATKTDKKQFWRAKKKIAYKNLKTAKNTGNGGWIKMLHKRIAKYDKHLGESFDAYANQVIAELYSSEK